MNHASKTNTAARWARTITSAFVLAGASIGVALPENEAGAESPHTTLEEVQAQKREEATEYNNDSRMASSPEARAIVWSSPHFTFYGGENSKLVVHNSNPQKSDVPTLKV